MSGCLYCERIIPAYTIFWQTCYIVPFIVNLVKLFSKSNFCTCGDVLYLAEEYRPSEVLKNLWPMLYVYSNNLLILLLIQTHPLTVNVINDIYLLKYFRFKSWNRSKIKCFFLIVFKMGYFQNIDFKNLQIKIIQIIAGW